MLQWLFSVFAYSATRRSSILSQLAFMIALPIQTCSRSNAQPMASLVHGRPFLLRNSGPVGNCFTSFDVITAERSVRYTTRGMDLTFASDGGNTHRFFARSTCRASTRNDSWGRQPHS